jgi:cytochrome c-type biogenesis protein CcmH
MLHCDFSDPMRRRIAQMQKQGVNDNAIVASIVREQGVVALASPPATGFGLFTWVMPGVALIIGFFIYSAYVRRNRKAPEPLTPADQAMIERFRAQIDRDFDEPELKK